MKEPRTRTAWASGAFPASALLPLRAFLGGTFVYAGVQKLSDPGFLHRGSRTYIGDQLRGFASHTPGGFLLRSFPLHHPAFAGVTVAFAEIAIGLLVLLGLATRGAAIAGLGLNLVLFLTASWHTSPYFLGSDIVFVFAWLPFVLAGASGQPALDHEIERQPATTRRELLARAFAVTGAGALALGGLSSLLKGRYRTAHAKAPARAQQPPASTTRQAPAPPAGAVPLGPSSALSSGQAALYRDPGDGQPDIVVREPSGQLAAFSAVCPHAGCRVSYNAGQLFCPCHGSVFDARTGAVLQGPAVQGLPARQVIERGGRIFALRA